MIDDILDLSAIRKGKIGLHLETVDIDTVLQNALSIFQPDIDSKGFSIQFMLHAAEHFVRADPSRLMQIFWNLIKNAIKFTPAGGVLTFASGNENGRIVIEVSNTGVGIKPTLLSRIFDSFEQGTRQVKGGYGGLGLGLTISKAIAEAHQSELLASSAGRNQGATFTLKMKTVLPPAMTPVRQIESEWVDTANGKSNLADPLRILLVDDHRDTVSTLKLLLTRLGYAVVSAESMAEALRAVDEGRFDLLVSDIGLPDGSGLDLMKRIRERQQIDGIALSGFGMEDDLRKSREAGFIDHLIKPVNLDRFQAA